MPTYRFLRTLGALAAAVLLGMLLARPTEVAGAPFDPNQERLLRSEERIADSLERIDRTLSRIARSLDQGQP